MQINVLNGYKRSPPPPLNNKFNFINLKKISDIFKLCSECEAFEWRAYDEVTYTPNGRNTPITESVPGHCILSRNGEQI